MVGMGHVSREMIKYSCRCTSEPLGSQLDGWGEGICNSLLVSPVGAGADLAVLRGRTCVHNVETRAFVLPAVISSTLRSRTVRKPIGPEGRKPQRDYGLWTSSVCTYQKTTHSPFLQYYSNTTSYNSDLTTQKIRFIFSSVLIYIPADGIFSQQLR